MNINKNYNKIYDKRHFYEKEAKKIIKDNIGIIEMKIN